MFESRVPTCHIFKTSFSPTLSGIYPGDIHTCGLSRDQDPLCSDSTAPEQSELIMPVRHISIYYIFYMYILSVYFSCARNVVNQLLWTKSHHDVIKLILGVCDTVSVRAGYWTQLHGSKTSLWYNPALCYMFHPESDAAGDTNFYLCLSGERQDRDSSSWAWTAAEPEQQLSLSSPWNVPLRTHAGVQTRHTGGDVEVSPSSAPSSFPPGPRSVSSVLCPLVLQKQLISHCTHSAGAPRKSRLAVRFRCPPCGLAGVPAHRSPTSGQVTLWGALLLPCRLTSLQQTGLEMVPCSTTRRRTEVGVHSCPAWMDAGGWGSAGSAGCFLFSACFLHLIR